jgi:hypothetical protein
MTLCEQCGRKIGIFEKIYDINLGKRICKDCFRNLSVKKDWHERTVDIKERIVEFLKDYF